MNIKLFKNPPPKKPKKPQKHVCRDAVFCPRSHPHFPRVGPGGVTLFDKSVLSVLIVFLLGRYEVSCSPSSPLRNLFLESLLCMFSVWKREREKKHLSKAFFEKRKSFPLFSEQKREQVSWLEKVKKMWKPPSLWWMVRRRQLQTTYQTLCT